MDRREFLAVVVVFTYALKELTSDTTRIKLEPSDVAVLELIGKTLSKAVAANKVNNMCLEFGDLLKEFES